MRVYGRKIMTEIEVPLEICITPKTFDKQFCSGTSILWSIHIKTDIWIEEISKHVVLQCRRWFWISFNNLLSWKFLSPHKALNHLCTINALSIYLIDNPKFIKYCSKGKVVHALWKNKCSKLVDLEAQKKLLIYVDD